jgi:hypothetical protein
MTNANISALALNPQNMVVPQISGGTLGFALTAASTQVLPANAQVQKVTFHNPGTENIFVCQAFDANGNALVPGQNAGNWQIFPGAILVMTGAGVAGAWLTSCPGGTGLLTVATSQTP